MTRKLLHVPIIIVEGVLFIEVAINVAILVAGAEASVGSTSIAAEVSSIFWIDWGSTATCSPVTASTGA